jgi:hypothetical protein
MGDIHTVAGEKIIVVGYPVIGSAQVLREICGNADFPGKANGVSIP